MQQRKYLTNIDFAVLEVFSRGVLVVSNCSSCLVVLSSALFTSQILEYHKEQGGIYISGSRVYILCTGLYCYSICQLFYTGKKSQLAFFNRKHYPDTYY